MFYVLQSNSLSSFWSKRLFSAPFPGPVRSSCSLWEWGSGLLLGLDVDREAVDLHILVGGDHEIPSAVNDADLQHVAALRSHRDGGVRGLYLEVAVLN